MYPYAGRYSQKQEEFPVSTIDSDTSYSANWYVEGLKVLVGKRLWVQSSWKKTGRWWRRGTLVR